VRALIEIGQAVWIAAERVVGRAKRVAGAELPEARQIHHVECADVVEFGAKMVLPKSALPKAEALRLFPVVAERRVAVDCSVQVELPQLAQICPHYLIGIHVDHLLHRERKEHVEKENFVTPNHALLL